MKKAPACAGALRTRNGVAERGAAFGDADAERRRKGAPETRLVPRSPACLIRFHELLLDIERRLFVAFDLDGIAAGTAREAA